MGTSGNDHSGNGATGSGGRSHNKFFRNGDPVDDLAVVTVLAPIKASLSDVCDGASCEVSPVLAGKTGMAKAYKFILDAMVTMGSTSIFDDTTTIDTELTVNYHYNTDADPNSSGLHDFTRDALFTGAGPTGPSIFSFTPDIPGADVEIAENALMADFNDAKMAAEGLNMDQQLMSDFLQSGVLGLDQFQIDAAIQSMTNMPESIGGSFPDNLDYVMNQLKAKDGNGDALLMTDQEVQDVAMVMTDSALGRNALCVATAINAIQAKGVASGLNAQDLYDSYKPERWTWRDLYKTPCNRFQSETNLQSLFLSADTNGALADAGTADATIWTDTTFQDDMRTASDTLVSSVRSIAEPKTLYPHIVADYFDAYSAAANVVEADTFSPDDIAVIKAAIATLPNLEFGQPARAVGLHIKAHVIAQNSFTESAIQAQLVQDMIDSDTWGGLNAVLNQILALEAQPGVSCADINDFEHCATTAGAMNGAAAYDPTLPDCFTSTPDTFVMGGDADLATHPFDWTKTTAIDDPTCDSFEAQDGTWDGLTAVPTAAVANEVDEIYLYGIITGFECTDAQGNIGECDLSGQTHEDIFEKDVTNYCKINAANTCAGTNYCSGDETLTCSCFAEDPVTLAAEAYTTPIMNYFKTGCLETTTENGGTAQPALGTAHLECISRALATLPAFGPTEAREVVMSHVKGSLYQENDFNKLEEIDACFESDNYIKHLTFILNNMAEFESKSTPTTDADGNPVAAECQPDFDEKNVFNQWDFTDKIDWTIVDFTTEGLTAQYQADLLDGMIQGNADLAATDTCIAMMTTTEEYELQFRQAAQFQGECNGWSNNAGTIFFNCPDADTEAQCQATFGPAFTMETCLGLNCVLSSDSTYDEWCSSYVGVGRWGWESGPTGYWGYNFFAESLAMYCDNTDDIAANGADDVVNCSANGEGGMSAMAGGSAGNTAMSDGRQAQILAGVASAMATMTSLGGNGAADNGFSGAITTWFQENDADNLHVVQNIMSMDNMAWEGFNFLLQAGGAMQGDGGYAAAGGAGGLVGLYDSFSNSGAWDGAWRTGTGNEAADGEWESTNGWINSNSTWWANAIDGMNWSEDYSNKWNTQEQYDTFYNHTFNRMPPPPPSSGGGSGSGNGNGGGANGGATSPSGPTFGATSPPGALAAGLTDDQKSKVNQDIMNTWDECLQTTPGITDGFRAIFDQAFVGALTDDGSVLPCDGIGAILEQKITDAVTTADAADPSGALLTEWNAYKDPANSQCPGCWDAQVIRAELQLRAFKQWGEDGATGFTTIEEFCAYDFTQIVSCADDGNTITAAQLSERVTQLGLPTQIYDSLHESEKVGVTATTAATPAGATTTAGGAAATTTAAGAAATTTAAGAAATTAAGAAATTAAATTAAPVTTQGGAGGGGANGTGNNLTTPGATNPGAGGGGANGTGNTPVATNAYGMISGDPHIKIKGANQEPVCFDITPKGSSMLSLVYDPVSGLEVNGEVVTEAHQKHRTIFIQVDLFVKVITYELYSQIIHYQYGFLNYVSFIENRTDSRKFSSSPHLVLKSKSIIKEFKSLAVVL